MKERFRRGATLLLLAVVSSLALVSIAAADDAIQLLQGTAILLDQSSGSGNGGNSTSTSSSTNIFSPAAFVDYKTLRG